MVTRDLAVSVRQRGGAAIIDLRGDVDASSEAALHRAYDDASGTSRLIVLNFAGTEYINSTGIALIVGVLARARSQGVQLSACGLSEHYREIFEITRLADFMRIVDGEADAVESAERGAR
jgi:anti-anti-sigma factor